MAVVRRSRVAMVMMPLFVFVRVIVAMRVVMMVMILRHMDVEFCAGDAALLRAGAVKVVAIEPKLGQFLFERRWIDS